ncbi:Uncharacterized protein dnm_070840 [Desulfonema magnum]|uniref:Uncharacterized protein n=1 Tax=Desulfonema magnum TaxID=45655 RepID=A0A975GRK4_9BACT|nr:Uncharacterized protein dnm_070840 [Desulfonema magnum]
MIKKITGFDKYLTISFRYLPGEETRVFFQNDSPAMRKNPSLSAVHRKKCIKNF